MLSAPTHAVFFTKRPVERQHFFDLRGDGVIHGSAGEVGERDHRFVRVLRHGDSHVLEQKLHLVGAGVRKIQQQNLLALVLDKSNAIVHREPQLVFPVVSVSPVVKIPKLRGTQEFYPNSDSTTL